MQLQVWPLLLLAVCVCDATLSDTCSQQVDDARQCFDGIKERFDDAEPCLQMCPGGERHHLPSMSDDEPAKECVLRALNQALDDCGAPREPHLCNAAKQCLKASAQHDEMKTAGRACKQMVTADCVRSLKTHECQCIQAAKGTVLDVCSFVIPEHRCDYHIRATAPPSRAA